MDEQKEKFNWQRLLITVGVIFVAAGVVGGGIWYYMDQNEKAQAKSYNDSVSSLQKQINELKTQTSATKTSNNSTSQAATTNNVMKISELGIQFILPSNMTDAYYVISKEGGVTQAGFTTKAIVAAGGPDCAGGLDKPVWAPLGAFSLTTTPPPNGVGDITTGGFVKQVSGKYLYFRGPQSACSATLSQAAASSQTGAMLKDAMLASAEAIQ